jgi:hypothetical protein
MPWRLHRGLVVPLFSNFTESVGEVVLFIQSCPIHITLLNLERHKLTWVRLHRVYCHFLIRHCFFLPRFITIVMLVCYFFSKWGGGGGVAWKSFFIRPETCLKHRFRLFFTSRKTKLMHKLFLVYFVNLYVFRAYLGQEVQPYVYSNWYLLFFLDDCLLFWLDNRQSSKKMNVHLSSLMMKVPDHVYVLG